MNQGKPYQDALDYIFSFIDYSRTHQENISAENFNLARMFEFMEVLGNPHQAYPSIHVAGTKGKGSVSAFCAYALQTNGYKVGLYTSPHLQKFTERIQVNGAPISEPDFVKLVNEIKPYVDKVPQLTSYEIQTALAFWYFAKQEVDIAVIEVGLGGRLDSTNVVTPLVSVITSISLDHVSILGDTLSAIAEEKGGIIKPGVPVVSAPQKTEALQVLKELAVEKQAPFTLVGEDVGFEVGEGSLAGQKFTISPKRENTKLNFESPLLGAHQVENAVTAYAALATAREAGLEIMDEDIREGFLSMVWLGRFEVFSEQPCVIFDVAHNRDSAKRLWEAVNKYLPGKTITLLFGALADKDIPGMFAELLPHVKTLILFRSEHPRAAPLEKLTEYAEPYGCEKIMAEDVSDTWRKARQIAREDGVILVTGSLTTVGELRPSWMQNFTEDGYNS